MQLSGEQPIGVFDSGVGGLTVAHAIKTFLPNEQIVYFGDTFHLPYGDKSPESVRYYSLKISDFLLEQRCKLIMIACNTASASAYDEVVAHVQDRALVVNVIDPVVQAISTDQRPASIGVIGTKGTINSGTYEKKLLRSNPNLKVVSLATPLFVPMIEEGFVFDDISNAIIRAYLSDEQLIGIQSLILGCTHYPIIKRQIEKFFNFNVDVLDSGQVVAAYLKRKLGEKKLLNPGRKADHSFYVSDYTDFFKRISKMFFEEELNLEKLDFWT